MSTTTTTTTTVVETPDELWAIRTMRPDLSVDMEIISARPTETLLTGLRNALLEGVLVAYEIRMGYLNGGDSRVEHREGPLL